jgi:Fur family ferric uptake transcriptional regulator
VIEPLTSRLDAEHSFTVDVGHLTVFGTCKECP